MRAEFVNDDDCKDGMSAVTVSDFSSGLHSCMDRERGGSEGESGVALHRLPGLWQSPRVLMFLCSKDRL